MSSTGGTAHRARTANLIIAGVNKSGTTSLFTYLSQHPAVCPSRVKETCHFLTYRFGEPPLPIATYEAQFSKCRGEAYRMESTPGYFYGGAAVAKAIRNMLGDVSIVVSLRDPVARLVSFYRFKQAMLELSPELSLEGYVERCLSLPDGEARTRANNTYWGVRGGFYDEYLDDWFGVFRDRMRVVFFEDFVSHPERTVRDLWTWLGLDTADTAELHVTHENSTVGFRVRRLQALALRFNNSAEPFLRRHPGLKRSLRSCYRVINGVGDSGSVLAADLRDRLEALYREHNSHAEAQLRAQGYQRLPAWLGAAARV